MRLAGIKPGDLVRCDRGGVRFFAEVEAVERGVLTIRPLDPRHTWRHAKARAVVDHWRKTK